MAPPGAFLLGVCALMLAIAVANAEAGSVVVGLAKCADCTRKNMKAEEAFKGLKVAIKCKNVHGDYESKAVGGLDGTGAFSVPLAANLHGADCVAQLHSAASNTPCTGQEPSKVVPVSGETTYGVVAGAKTATASPECASVTMCGPIKKHILEHFHHKKPVPPKPEPKPQPHPDYHPIPPTPTYGGGGGHPSTPIYHAEPSETMLGPIKKHILEHFHHKKPVPPKPQPKPQPHPDYHPVPPTPTYSSGGGHPSTPIYHVTPSATMLGPIKKHILEHFHHKKPVPPKPEPKPQPHPDYHPVPPTPKYGGGGGHPSTPIYHATPSTTMLGPIKKHILEHFHHKKPVPPKPEPKPQPHPDYHPVPPTPKYGGGGGHPSTPIYHATPSATMLGPIKKHILEHFHHKKPVPPKPEPKPQPHPDYHPVPPTTTYGGGGGHPSTPIYHAEPSMTVVGPIKKHILDHFHHKKPVPPKPEPKPQPHPDYHPVPPTPTYGGGHPSSSTPIYHPPAQH
ncbi:hypothetical protein ACQ4PT_013738 [Festuca glaucescens]